MNEAKVKELLIKFLEHLLDNTSTFVSVASFISKNKTADKNLIYSFMQPLKLFNVIKYLEDENDILITLNGVLSDAFIKSYLEYIRNDLNLISNWDKGHSNTSCDEILTWGNSFLLQMEKKRFYSHGCSKTIDDKDLALFVIKANVQNIEEPCYLMQFNDITLRYQFIGGYLKHKTHSIEENMQLLIQRELKLNDFKVGDDLIAKEFFEKIHFKSISGMNGVLTLYRIQCYSVMLGKPILKLQPGDTWVTLSEIRNGYTNEGISLQTPFENLSREKQDEFIIKLSELPVSSKSIQKETKRSKIDLIDQKITKLVFEPESNILEYKSSIRWDYIKKEYNRLLEVPVLKTIAGFLNTNGGQLTIGVDDNKEILGLSADIETLTKQNEDGYLQFITNLVSNSLGNEVMAILKVNFYSMQDKRVCVIEVNKSTKPIFIKRGDQREFYIRSGNTTKMLNPEEVYNYIQIHW
jgi:hypothetical protein